MKARAIQQLRASLRMALVLVLLGFSAASAHADTLVLKSGERLKGSWERVEGTNLIFKSDTLGEVTVPASNIQSLSTTVPAVAILKNGKTVEGYLHLGAKGQWMLLPTQTNVPSVNTFTVIYPVATFHQYQKTSTSIPWRNWHGSANGGYGLQTGNTQARTLTATVDATRKQPDILGIDETWRTKFFLSSLLAHTKDNLTGASVSSNTFSTTIRQDRLFDDGNYVFVFGQFDHIQPESIRGRETVGGGYGRDIIHTSKTTFSVLGGLTFVNTNFLTAGAPSQQSAELLVGEQFSTQFLKAVHLTHYVNFYPNLSQTGQYFFNTQTSLSIPLFKKLSFQISFIDFYLSNPPTGSLKNNATFSTGIGYNF